MILLREIIESDLADTLEGEFRLPVILISPDGATYQNNENDPELDLVGQVLYESTNHDPETGFPVVVGKPVVTLRRTSLKRVPVSGEKWAVKIPAYLQYDAPKVTFILERAIEFGGSIGFVRLYLTRAGTKPEDPE